MKRAKIVRETLDPEEDYGARLSTAKACTFCKRPYIKPCSDKIKDSCPNFIHLQSKRK